MAKHIYAFEDIPEADLPRPPLCALRALRVAGIALTRPGWAAMPIEARQELALAGARDAVITPEVQRIMERAPIREIKLVPRIDDPPEDEVPPLVAGAFGPTRPIALEFWQTVRPLDRHVLTMFVNNTRLMWRAVAEIALRSRYGHAVLPTRGWTGTLAHAEVHMPVEVAHKLASPSFLDGRGCILARVAGIRAARWASEILDFHASQPTGPVEVGFAMEPVVRPGLVVWQAHVSTLEGEFSPSASVLAASTSAAALHDIVARAGGKAVIESVRLIEEPWLDTNQDEEVTVGL